MVTWSPVKYFVVLDTCLLNMSRKCLDTIVIIQYVLCMIKLLSITVKEL